jgi:hypothetical protein
LNGRAIIHFARQPEVVERQGIIIFAGHRRQVFSVATRKSSGRIFSKAFTFTGTLNPDWNPVRRSPTGGVFSWRFFWRFLGGLPRPQADRSRHIIKFGGFAGPGGGSGPRYRGSASHPEIGTLRAIPWREIHQEQRHDSEHRDDRGDRHRRRDSGRVFSLCLQLAGSLHLGL